MKQSNVNMLQITEGVGGVWFYHLSLVSTDATGLCGAKTMHTSIPLVSWGVRGHLKEGWCSECEAMGTSELQAAGASLTVGRLIPSPLCVYCANESVPAALPPIERGLYAVLRENGQTQEGVWNGRCWEGLTDVVSYSGVPRLLSLAQREQCRRNIRAGVEVPEGHKERTLAKLSALRLARYRAVTIAKAVSEADQLLHIRDMVGHFKVACTLGVSYSGDAPSESTETDRALFAWGIEQIRARDPKWFLDTARGIETPEGIRGWLDNR